MTLQEKFGIYYWSIRYLKPSMVYWRVHRTLKSAGVALADQLGAAAWISKQSPADVRAASFPQLSSRYHCEEIDLAGGKFSFLKDTLTLPKDRTARVRAVAEKPLLWQFHYGYHDYLLALCAEAGNSPECIERALAFVERWSGDHPLHGKGARKSAWHAYVVSIRIESWVRLHAFATEAGIAASDPRLAGLRRGVEHMLRVLLRNLERGTMANHLMRNIKALVLGGLFLDHPTGMRSLKQGLPLLRAELHEQILDDGCHFERSPMYHVSVLNDVLDMAEALYLRQMELSPVLLRSVERMTAFLSSIPHPDGEVPYLNDSTQSFFLRTGEVLQRGRDLCARLGIGIPVRMLETDEDIDPTRVSGLLTHRRDDLYLVFDAGLIGPDYQPGHAHCDTLSYELSLDGQRVITDTGVFHYRESKERSYARSTAAHNTVQIDGAEQSEIWKSFRVGRRARIVAAKSYSVGTLRVLQAAHDGYTRLSDGLVHERAMVISGSEWICVIDWLHGEGMHRVVNRVHFHPHTIVRAAGGDRFAVNSGSREWMVLHAGREAAGLQSTQFYPAFGAKKSRPSLVLSADAPLPHLTAYLLLFAGDPPAVHLEHAALEARITTHAGEVTIRSRLTT